MDINIVILCQSVKKQTIEWVDEINLNTPFRTIIISDERIIFNDESTPKIRQTFHFDEKTFGHGDKYKSTLIHQVDDDYMLQTGFFGCNLDGEKTHIKKKVIAYDKFFQYCDLKYQNHTSKFEQDFYLVFEEDVFIPSINALTKFIDKYCEADLVLPNNTKPLTLKDWHWPSVKDYFKYALKEHEESYYTSSMACCVGISEAFIQEILHAQKVNGRFTHIEAMFTTIANMYGTGFDFRIAPELKSCVAMGDWTFDHIASLPNNFFHPIKNNNTFQYHPLIRTKLAKALEENYKPNIELPDFLINHE